MKNFARFLFVIATSVFVVQGCRKENADLVGPAGSFQYRAYDTTGILVAQGWFTLNAHDSSHVDGEWHFNQVGNPKNIGPQIGEGRLQGGFEDSVLSVNLNPQYVDNNVFLNGTYDGSSFKGIWIWIGFPGEIGIGRFSSVK
jgi:hypothetical protein